MIEIKLKFKSIEELDAMTEMLRSGFKEETNHAEFFSDTQTEVMYSKVYAKALIQIIATMKEVE